MHTVTRLLILAVILSSCNNTNSEAPTSKKEAAKKSLAPLTLVIDEVSCKACAKDMVENYAAQGIWAEVIYLTADPFGKTLTQLDSNIQKVPRTTFVNETKLSGSFLINENGDTLQLSIKNYRQELDAVLTK